MELRTNKINVTIVVCTCNRAAMLPPAIDSLLKQQTDDLFDYEVLIVDDGSTDNTPQVVAGLIAENSGRPLRYVCKRAGGVADARNAGVRQAAGEIIAFFDDDQIAEPRWLAELMRVAWDKRADCVGGSVGLLLSESMRLGFGPKSRRILGERERGNSPRQYKAPDFPGTGNVLIAKRLFKLIGGFDTTLREGGEDTDFFARLRRHGVRIWYSPQARVFHIIPPSRLTSEFLQWVSLKGGVAAARLDRKSGGFSLNAFRAVERLGITVARDLPRSVIARLTSDRALRTDCLCTMGHTLGYWRGWLHFLSPRLFRQQKFMEYVDFRSHGGERSEFATRPASRQR